MQKKRFLISAFLVLLSIIPAVALADCSEVGSEEWEHLNLEMVRAFNAGDYPAALDYSLKLAKKCDESPTLMYTISDIYRRLNNEPKSLEYVQSACAKSSHYDLPPQLMEAIWYRRAELESPQMQAVKEENDSLKQQISSANSLANYHNIVASASYSEDTFETLKWVGTGVAAIGGAAAITGAVLMGIYHHKANETLNTIDVEKDNASSSTSLLNNLDYRSNNKYNVTSNYKSKFNKLQINEKAGIALFAAGLGVGITGAALAIFSHIQIDNIEFTKPADVPPVAMSISLSPTGGSLQITF